VTTVGFGDLVPTTNSAKLFTVFYVIGGIGIVTSFINERLQRHARRIVAGRGEQR
jgi:voltage-gated potassium channel